jgi:hypothetical protein
VIIPPRTAFVIREGGVGSGNFGHAGRKGAVGGSGASDAISKTAAGSRKYGSTVALNGSVPTSGYVVAGVKNDAGEKNESTYDHPVSRNEVKQYVQANLPELEKPNRFLGSWSDKGKVYLDTPEVHTDRKRSLQLAHDRDEIAIWHLDKGEEVHTMSDKQRPSESKGTRITESKITTQTRSSYLIQGNDLTVDQRVDAIMAQIASTKPS